MFSRFKFFLIIILACSSLIAGAQITPNNIGMEHKNTPETKPKPAYISIPVEVTWHGDVAVKIIIGTISKLFKENQTLTIYPPIENALKIQVVTPSSDFSCKSFFVPENSPGYLNIYLKDNEVTYTYKTKRGMLEDKAAEDRALAVKAESQKAEVRKTADEKARTERETAQKLAADKENQRRAIQEKSAAEKIVQANSTKMILVEGGSYTMGCTRDQEENCYPSERPDHKITLHSFYISKYDVTQEQWESLMGSNPSKHQGCPTCPVELVTWNDAMEYISKLNRLTGKNYRLPTEAEWEYAARGGNKTKNFKYAGSNNIDDVSWHDANSQLSSQPVGIKAPNELGLYDMTGNVWQFCSDWYDEHYYSESPAENPTGPSSGTTRSKRGGSWNYPAKVCHISFRSQLIPDGGMEDLGFRLASDN